MIALALCVRSRWPFDARVHFCPMQKQTTNRGSVHQVCLVDDGEKREEGKGDMLCVTTIAHALSYFLMCISVYLQFFFSTKITCQMISNMTVDKLQTARPMYIDDSKSCAPFATGFFLSVLWVCVYGCMRALKNHPPAFKPTPSPMHASSSLYASRVFSVINDLHKVCHTHTHTRTPVKYVRDRVTSVLCYFCSRSSGDTATIWRSTRSPRGLGKWGECTRMRFFFEKCQEKGSLETICCRSNF